MMLRIKVKSVTIAGGTVSADYETLERDEATVAAVAEFHGIKIEEFDRHVNLTCAEEAQAFLSEWINSERAALGIKIIEFKGS